MDRAELSDWLRLTLASGVGNETARKLLSAFGLPQSVFSQSSAALQQVVSAAQAAALKVEPPELENLLDVTWRWLQASGTGAAQRQILALSDPDYPVSLLNIEDPPLMLYLLGGAALPAPGLAFGGVPSIAVVG